MKQKIKDLRDFYDLEAQKFTGTRKRHWYEFDYILDKLKSINKKNIKIVELGCGSGRFFEFLRDNLEVNFEYVGVDFSNGLINIARKNYPGVSFEVVDMVSYLELLDQESVDVIISIASFQHLDSNSSRLKLLEYARKSLKYDGLRITLNRSFSRRFLRQFWFVISKSVLKYLFSFGIFDWKDLMIPRDGPTGNYYRYYHIFTPNELSVLHQKSNFKLDQIGYLDRNGKFSNLDWKNSRNSVVVAQKSILQ